MRIFKRNEKMIILSLFALIGIIIFFLYMKKIESFDTITFIGKNINLKTNINNNIMYVTFLKIMVSTRERDKCAEYELMLDSNKKTTFIITEGYKKSPDKMNDLSISNTYYIKSVEDNYYVSRRLILFNKVCGDSRGDTDEFTIEEFNGKILIGAETIIAGKKTKKYVGVLNNKLIFVDDKTNALQFEYNII
jgi:hypothetical protein